MKKDERLKIGFVGLGQRGAGWKMTDGSTGLLGNVLKNADNVVVTAICDKYPERIEAAKISIMKAGQAEPLQSTDYMDVVNAGVDAIIVSTSWALHVAVALAAMEAGVPVAIEVGGTHNIDDCWKLVDMYEKTGTPFFFLENCCYNKQEALVTSLVRNGVLGNVSYCQGYYCHDLREEIIGCGIRNNHYRLEEYRNNNCENYPTHELGPIAKILNINSGNRFVKLVSMSSKAQGLKEYIESKPEYEKLMPNKEFKQGDVTTTMIECENGETIFLKLDTTLPRLYERGVTVSGTKGFYYQTMNMVVLDDGSVDHESAKMIDQINTADKYDEYLPDDWRLITKEQIEAGHGGMDYVMLRHFFKCVKEKRPMPIDVYDAVSWMSITALSAESIKNGSQPVEVPDFTRGKYKNRKTVDVLDLPVINK
ncbi:MAG: Gfo/Idh/MocA family oxidoreductase [Clostridia bacterium]|nr:Gfo/Idh/MocA family oxidoreductase [Clostridia bacterium]